MLELVIAGSVSVAAITASWLFFKRHKGGHETPHPQSSSPQISDAAHEISSILSSNKKWITYRDQASLIKFIPPEIQADKKVFSQKFKEAMESHNLNFTLSKNNEFENFFNTIEKNPLTFEQIQACICMDPHVLIVAAAGSGKTSTMVAKAGYVIKEKLARPEQILMLAFNQSAAEELRDRVQSRLSDFPDCEKITTSTFHAFGMHVIHNVSGQKPPLAPWLGTPSGDIRKIESIIRELLSKNTQFSKNWNIFRALYYRHSTSPIGTPSLGVEILTAKGETVSNEEERLIADWLYRNNVAYSYRKDFPGYIGSSYRPTFSIDGTNVYWDHILFGGSIESAIENKRFRSSIMNNRSIHKEHNTAYIETTSADMPHGFFSKVSETLIRNGVTLTFNPDRKGIAAHHMSHHKLITIIRSFQQHVKNNNLTTNDLKSALHSHRDIDPYKRFPLFLSIYLPIAAAWDNLLRSGNYIDFEDMLTLASRHIASGAYKSPFTVILADEFQDSSRSRVELLKSLCSHNTHLCVVGDDWQGINRFAGSDISVMTDFGKTFPKSTQLVLSTTFRCPIEICDASSGFIQRNPTQIKKDVSSTNFWDKNPINFYGVFDPSNLDIELNKRLSLLCHYIRKGAVVSDNGKRISVMVLGRYNHDVPSSYPNWEDEYGDVIDITFKTVHSSKGLEADYVFIVNVNKGVLGFPSEMDDDPVFRLAMPKGDKYPFAEERRLFYVALTRAKRQVHIFTSLINTSPFAIELSRARGLKITPIDVPDDYICPVCKEGALVPRVGPHGMFLGCTSYPDCTYTE